MTNPPAPKSAAPSARLIGFVAVVVLIAAVITAVAKHGGGDAPSNRQRPSTGPSAAAAATVSSDYYLAVKAQDARTAYGLLCAEQQQVGYSTYAAEVAADTKFGTGVASFHVTGAGRVDGSDAAVPAQISLANGESTPILVLLVYVSTSWRVCSSNLGGVLPGAGPGVNPATSPTPTPIASI